MPHTTDLTTHSYQVHSIMPCHKNCWRYCLYLQQALQELDTA